MAKYGKRYIASVSLIIKKEDYDDPSLTDIQLSQIKIFKKAVKNSKKLFKKKVIKTLSEEQYQKQISLIDKLCPDQKAFILCSNNPEHQGSVQQMLQPLNIKS